MNLAIVRLSAVVEPTSMAEAAFELLVRDGLRLIRQEGRRDRVGFARLLASLSIAVIPAQ